MIHYILFGIFPTKDQCMQSTSASNACALQVVRGQTKPMSQYNNCSLLDKGHTKNRQRMDKGQDRIPCTWETSPALCLPFVYSLSLLCLVKNNWRTVTHLLFSRSLSAKHMRLMHSCSACVSSCPQCLLAQSHSVFPRQRPGTVSHVV